MAAVFALVILVVLADLSQGLVAAGRSQFLVPFDEA